MSASLVERKVRSLSLARSGPFYDVVPIDPRYTRYNSQVMRVIRRLAQGAGSGLLMFAGADSMTANAATPQSTLASLDFTSFEGVAQSVLAGNMTGPMQILAAVLLFIATGKCMSRFIGLIAVAAIFFLHMQGVTLNEAGAFAADIGGSILNAVQTAEA